MEGEKKAMAEEKKKIDGEKKKEGGSVETKKEAALREQEIGLKALEAKLSEERKIVEAEAQKKKKEHAEREGALKR